MRLLALAIVASLLGAVLWVTQQPAHASGWGVQRLGETSPGVATRPEFNQTTTGMPRWKVHQLYGVGGKFIRGEIGYPTARSWRAVVVYPTRNGVLGVTILYRDPGNDGGPLVVAEKYWHGYFKLDGESS